MTMLLALFAMTAYARVLYVSTAGLDTNPGTFELPFRTISKGYSIAAAGDTIILRGGTFVLTATTSLSKSGTSVNKYYLLAYPGEYVLLDFSGAASGARVTAVEPASHRAELVERNVVGLGVEVLRVDGRESGLPPASFDRVLVDAPCTGLGALRRRPEARWRRQPGDVPALAKLQRELLAAAIALTRPGGVVLYATCSPHLAETVGIVSNALRKHPVEALDTRSLFVPVDELGAGPHVQLWPHLHGTDAMFAAALRVVG